MKAREFLLRYERRPQVREAESIGGVASLGSRVAACQAKADTLMQVWLGTYASRHQETEALPNVTLISDAENTVQPDALLRLLPEHGGLSHVNEDGHLAGPRELPDDQVAVSVNVNSQHERVGLGSGSRDGARRVLHGGIGVRFHGWLACALALGLLVAAGATRAAGEVVGWGRDDFGQADAPVGSNFVAVAGGFLHSVGLLAGGTVVAWGDDYYGQADVPAYVTNAVGIAASDYGSLAGVGGWHRGGLG